MIGPCRRPKKGGSMNGFGMITEVKDGEVETLQVVNVKNTDGTALVIRFKCRLPFIAYMHMACSDTEH